MKFGSEKKTSKSNGVMTVGFLLNALQYEMWERVADQVCVELRARTTNYHDDFHPLLWSLHGGRGTGKYHVIKIIKTELF